MKKFNFMALQVVLGLILGLIGFAIFKQDGKIALVSMMAPAITIVASSVFEFIKFKKFYLYLIAYLVLISALDGAAIYGHSIEMDQETTVVIGITVVIVVGICYLFHWIYQNIKKPRTL